MAYSLIFLNPSVLMDEHARLNLRCEEPACFDPEAFARLNKLIARVENAVIVLIFPCRDENDGPSLERLKAAYQDCGLGERIIGKIDDPALYAINDGKLVDDWLCANKDSFPIKSFVIISNPPKDRHCHRSVRVKDILLSESNVLLAETILKHGPFDPREIPAKEIYGLHTAKNG